MTMINVNNENELVNDYFDIKLAEADNAIKNGAKFYTREEVDAILSTRIKGTENIILHSFYKNKN